MHSPFRLGLLLVGLVWLAGCAPPSSSDLDNATALIPVSPGDTSPDLPNPTDNTPSDPSDAADNDSTPTLTTVDGSQTTVQTLSSLSSGSFEIGEQTTSFLLSAFSNGTARIVSLISPSGRDEVAYLESTAGGLTSFGDGVYDNYLVPMRPDIAAQAGTWRYQISGADSLKLTVREELGTSTSAATLHLQPYLTTTTSRDLSEVWSRVETLYTSNNLQVIIEEPVQIGTGEYAVVSSSFFDTMTQALVSQGGADTVNLFLLEDFRSAGGTLGIAAGIPGSLGMEGPYNGVLVSLSAHESGFFRPVLQTELLAETIVHEAGHLLGLWHPTEENGIEFDPLDDTPECSLSPYDTNRDGSVSAEECLGRGGENIMFWTSLSSGRQEAFSTDQQSILQQSPLAFQGSLQGVVNESDPLTLTYDSALAETVATEAATVASIRDYVDLLPECQRSSTPQSIDLILAQGCVNFQEIHYRPEYLPENLDGLATIEGYVAEVNQQDRFSYYFEPVSFASNTEALEGGRSYIGFTYAVSNAEAVISESNPFVLGAIYPFTRAWWDGLEAGDQLLAVDGESVFGKTVEEIRSLLPTEESEATTLLLERAGEQLTLQTASETHLSRRVGTSNQIAYLNLREYTTVSASRMESDFQSLLGAGTVDGLILDLRHNGGGSLQGAWQLTDLLTPESLDGEPLFTIQTQSLATPYAAGPYPSSLSGLDATHFVVLMDEYSASASEITAAALQELGVARLLGGTSYGKGVGQNVVGLLDGSGVYITSFELLSPEGNSWHEQGVSPDQNWSTVVPNTPAEDEMLAAAVSWIESGELPGLSGASPASRMRWSQEPTPYTHPWDGGSRQGLQ